jgi:hypothetical protein
MGMGHGEGERSGPGLRAETAIVRGRMQDHRHGNPPGWVAQETGSSKKEGVVRSDTGGGLGQARTKRAAIRPNQGSSVP